MFPRRKVARPNEAAFDAKSGLTFLITHLPLRLYGYRRRGRHIRGPKAAVARGRAVVCSFVAARLLSQCRKIHSTKSGAGHNAIHASTRWPCRSILSMIFAPPRSAVYLARSTAELLGRGDCWRVRHDNERAELGRSNWETGF